jgi:hypothetical protein
VQQWLEPHDAGGEQHGVAIRRRLRNDFGGHESARAIVDYDLLAEDVGKTDGDQPRRKIAAAADAGCHDTHRAVRVILCD